MPPEGGVNWVPIILQLALLAAIFYFLLIRPQKKKDKAFKSLLESMSVGDNVTTIGGMHGKITKIKDDKIVMEMGTTEKTQVHLYKWGIKDIRKKEQA